MQITFDFGSQMGGKPGHAVKPLFITLDVVRGMTKTKM